MKGFCHSDELTDNLIFIQAIIRAAAFNSVRFIVDQTDNESAFRLSGFSDKRCCLPGEEEV